MTDNKCACDMDQYSPIEAPKAQEMNDLRRCIKLLQARNHGVGAPPQCTSSGQKRRETSHKEHVMLREKTKTWTNEIVEMGFWAGVAGMLEDRTQLGGAEMEPTFGPDGTLGWNMKSLGAFSGSPLLETHWNKPARSPIAH